eukprot:6849814-Pyramimonas_sp.AAC.1
MGHFFGNGGKTALPDATPQPPKARGLGRRALARRPLRATGAPSSHTACGSPEWARKRWASRASSWTGLKS